MLTAYEVDGIEDCSDKKSSIAMYETEVSISCFLSAVLLPDASGTVDKSPSVTQIWTVRLFVCIMMPRPARQSVWLLLTGLVYRWTPRQLRMAQQPSTMYNVVCPSTKPFHINLLCFTKRTELK